MYVPISLYIYNLQVILIEKDLWLSERLSNVELLEKVDSMIITYIYTYLFIYIHVYIDR
jgi:hypothetical protein